MKRIFTILAALSLTSCGINSVPTAEEAAKARWADVEANYQRRANLIPNLVAVTKAAAAAERDTLTAVIEARARATSVTISANDLDDPEKLEAYKNAQEEVSRGLARLLVSVERYPELKSQRNFSTLMVQLEGTENRIAVSIRDYNDAVRNYNTTIRTFPSAIGANIVHGAEPMEFFEAQPSAAFAPEVTFDD